MALALGPMLSMRMAQAGRPEPWFNLLAAAVGVAGLVPFLLFVAVAILRLTDEWNRHVGLVGYVAAFTGATLFFGAIDFLKAVGLVRPWSFTPVWPWLAAWFAAGLLGSGLWHKRRG